MAITVYPPYGSSSSNPANVAFGGNQVDAFGRLRVSNPYTLFDSQARFGNDTAYDTSTANGGTVTYATNKSQTNLSVTTTAGSQAVRQTFRTFPYQPGKSLLILQTFYMDSGAVGLVQRVGFFSTNNGVYLEKNNNTVSFVIRTFTSGSVDNSRAVTQANWNGDKLDGTGPSGIVLDTTKSQILWFDIEWLGVGNVRCGFILNGQYITCHTFQNANLTVGVYMQTAILPLRYEITNTASASGTLAQICSTVMSEGGYEQTSQIFNARQTTLVSSFTTTFVPLISIRLNSSYLGAVVIPAGISGFPSATGTYEFALIKNAALTVPGTGSWNTTLANGQVDVDTSATAMTFSADNVVQSSFANASNQSTSTVSLPTGYNWDLQLGVSLAGASDTYTLAARLLAVGGGVTSGSAYGTLSFYDITV
jgi:hypothetical protein